ncbi:heavy-metal-associated domain-containing protein [Candidatus Pacearchaeota archaeon]|nr:heavy-metal-associated domain-containing protein [Candidatus Pacearchaeota archaeon]
MKKFKVLIQGMHCASCASNIERSVGKVSGVKSCSVSLMTRKSLIECDDNVKEEEIKKAVARAGYQVVSIEK